MQTVIVNWWAVLGAAVAAMVVGFLWYGPLFGKMWMRLTHMSEADMGKGGMGKAYFWAFVSSVVTAYVLLHILSYAGAASTGAAIQGAFWVWLGFIATSQLSGVLWMGKPFQLYVLDTLHYLVTFVVMAVILFRWG